VLPYSIEDRPERAHAGTATRTSTPSIGLRRLPRSRRRERAMHPGRSPRSHLGRPTAGSVEVRTMTARSADNLRTKLRGRTLVVQVSGL
jgi:hypothetical protein